MKEYIHIPSHVCRPFSQSKTHALACPPVLLHTVIDEYSKQYELSDKIDSKSIGILTVMIAIITVYLPLFPFEKLRPYVLYRSSHPNISALFMFACLFWGIALLFSGLSVYDIMQGLILQPFKGVNIESFNKDSTLAALYPSSLQIRLIDHYQHIIKVNGEYIIEKSRRLNSAYNGVFKTFIFISFSTILARILSAY